MKKAFIVVVTAILLAGCKDAEPKRDIHKEYVTEARESAASKKAEVDRVHREWQERTYSTGEPFRVKEMSRVSYSDSRESNSSHINMRLVADGDVFSFEIFPKNTEVNKSHIGGYTITAVNEGGIKVFFENRGSGRAVISRKDHSGSYKAFDGFFRDSREASVTVRDGYVSVYRGWLDTRYY